MPGRFMANAAWRVPPVVGLHFRQRQGPVGDEHVVVPGGEQRQLRAGRAAYSVHDQADWRAWRLSPAKTVNAISALPALETSGVLSQYGIHCHALSVIASIAARTRLSCRAVIEKRTSNLTAAVSTFLA